MFQTCASALFSPASAGFSSSLDAPAWRRLARNRCFRRPGFQSRTPITAKQKAAYAKLPAYELHQGTLKGRTIYAYKDEKAGVVYLGSQAEYAQYKQLAAKAKLKEEQITAARIELDEKDAKLYQPVV